LFARTGATTGKTHLVKEAPHAVFASYLIRIRPKPPVKPEYLYSFFQSDAYWTQILEEKEGSAQPNVNGQKLMNILVPMLDSKIQVAISKFIEVVRNRQDGSFEELPELPPPLEEQRRIVTRVEELVGKIEEVRSLRQQALKETEIVLKSVLNLAFERNFNKQGWELIPLRQAAEVARGKFTHRPRNEPRFYGGNIPFIQIGDISNSKRYILEYSQTLNEEGLKISKMFPKETVVIAITGATIGVTGILTFDSCFPDSIVGIVPDQKKVIPEFVYWSLEYTKKVALAEATQTTQPNINLKNLDKLTIPVPPLSEQRRIVAYLDELQTKIDTMKKLREEAIKELDAILPSILDKAFKGEL
jgi:type I restriction enzyme S subunit